MSRSEGVENKRAGLGFEDLVRQRFSFLAEYGFCEIESLATIVRYRKGDLELNVCHERLSYEVDLQIGHAEDLFYLEELIHACDPEAAKRYKKWMASTAATLAPGVERLAELVGRYGDRALRDDPDFFEDLRKNRKFRREEYALNVLASQTRPKAEAAFREGRYREAADLYESIAPQLSPAERGKLEAARKRS